MNPPGVETYTDPLYTEAQARLGQVVREKWRLDRLLGVGGMAAVYAATHRNGAKVAIKVLHRELGLNAEAKGRFLREGYVVNTVEHPGTVRVLDDDVTDDGAPFLVMELLEGETVDARVRRLGGRLEPAGALGLLDQLLDVLAAAHAKGVLHRDLKPENLFITTDAKLKVLDFGIARLREGSSSESATRTGSVMGTPAFMAPEQARGLHAEVDARTDLWAAAASTFAMLTGRAPHEGRTPNEVLLSAMTQPVAPIGSLVSGLGAEVVAFLDRALAFEQGARFPDATSMQRALRKAWAADQAGGALPTELVPAPTSAPVPARDSVAMRTPSRSTGVAFGQPTGPDLVAERPSERSVAALAAAAGGVVLVLAVGAWMMLRAPSPSVAAPGLAPSVVVGAGVTEAVPLPATSLAVAAPVEPAAAVPPSSAPAPAQSAPSTPAPVVQSPAKPPAAPAPRPVPAAKPAKKPISSSFTSRQ